MKSPLHITTSTMRGLVKGLDNVNAEDVRKICDLKKLLERYMDEGF